jgi:hypothetical protein
LAVLVDENPPMVDGDERATLCSFLDYLRACVPRKVEGLREADAWRAMVPSSTSVAWLVTHLTAAEVNLFQRMFAGRLEAELVPPEPPTDDRLDLAVARYLAACEESRTIVDASGDLGAMATGRTRKGRQATLRWTLVHTIEETARHLGHLDILREQIDGAVGL